MSEVSPPESERFCRPFQHCAIALAKVGSAGECSAVMIRFWVSFGGWLAEPNMRCRRTMQLVFQLARFQPSYPYHATTKNGRCQRRGGFGACVEVHKELTLSCRMARD
jgi:hypothetical protein